MGARTEHQRVPIEPGNAPRDFETTLSLGKIQHQVIGIEQAAPRSCARA